MDLILASEVDGVEIVRRTTTSYADEVDRNTADNAALCGGSVGIIAALMTVLLGGKPPIQSRILLGLGGVLTILASIGVSYGLGAYFTLPNNTFSQLVIYVVMGAGVDDMIVLVDCFDRSTKRTLEEQVAEALGEAGVARGIL